MKRRGVQLNIRSDPEVAEALREEADRRNLSLGSTLAALLTLARAGRESGVWLTLPFETERALKAVAAARGREPGSLLAELIAGRLRRDLMDLAASLEDALPPEQDDDEEPPEDDVGIFTVFD